MSEIIKWVDSDGNIHSGSILESKGEYQVLDCNVCGFKHVIPIPTEEFLEEYYSTEYFGKRGEAYFEKLENEYEWNKILFLEKYDYFEKYINSSKPSLLDIGCSMGLFLKTGTDRGWELKGIEPGIELAKYAHNLGLEVENEFLNESNYKDFGTFDVINMTEVLEHIKDPNNMIDFVVEMINPNGLLSITCPNDFNPLQLVFREQQDLDPWWVAPPEHLNYFDIGSMTKLLERKGLRVVESTVSFPLEFYLLMGDNYIGDNKVGSYIHQKRMNFELNLFKSGREPLRRSVYKKFAELNLGREFTLIARRESI